MTKKEISTKTYFDNIFFKGLILGLIAGSAHLITINLLKRKFKLN